MTNRTRTLIVVLGALVVLGFVLRKYVVTEGFGDDRIFWIGYASVLTLVVARIFLNRRELKNQS